MKSGTIDHPKMHGLAEDLELPLYAAVGIMEMLWDWAGQYARDGGIGKYSDKAIAKAIKWEGDAEKLTAALLKNRWIDKHKKFRFVIHDWPNHCENFIHLSLARGAEYFADGSMPNLSKFNQTDRKEILGKYGCARTVRACTSVPKPMPMPIKERKKKESKSPRLRGQGSPETSPAARRDADWEGVRKKLIRYRARMPMDEKRDAKTFHDAIEQYLKSLGVTVEREYPVAVNGRKGRIDLVIVEPFKAAIELDRVTARQGSLAKIEATGYPGLALCREPGMNDAPFVEIGTGGKAKPRMAMFEPAAGKKKTRPGEGNGQD